MTSSRKYKIKKGKTRRIKKTNAYVINLDESTERWEQIQKDFKDTNIHLIRVSAIKNDYGKLGLLLTLKKIIRMAKEKNLETVLILEDDTQPAFNVDIRWNKIKKWLDNNMDKWEIFNGGALLYDFDSIETRLIHTIEDIKIYKSTRIFTNNFIYINSSIYDKILSWEFFDDHVHVDYFTGNSKLINVIHTFPLLVKQINGKSILENRERNFDKNYINLNTYFNNLSQYQKFYNKEKAYVINLNEATERWKKIQDDFKNTNIHLIRVPAVKNTKNPKQGLLDTFQNIIRLAKKYMLKTVLVLEDDSYPTPDFNKRWRTIKKWLDNNMDKWEIFNGGIRIHNLRHKKTEKIIILRDNISIYKTTKVESTNFLYINNSMYDKILSWNFDNDYTALDHLTGDFRKTNMIYIYPLLSKQHDGLSYIQNKNRVLDDIYIENEKYFKNFNKEPLIKTLENKI